MKKSEIKKLDLLWAKKIKERANYTCEYCLEKNAWVNAAHIIGRRYRGTRWMLDNGICLCYGCHRAYDEHAPRAEKIRRLVIGEYRLNKLLSINQEVAKYQDFETIRKELGNAT